MVFLFVCLSLDGPVINWQLVQNVTGVGTSSQVTLVGG